MNSEPVRLATVGEQVLGIRFWLKLQEQSKLNYMVTATKALPVDKNGGLMNVYHSIWNDSRFISLFIYLLFLALNVFTVVTNFLQASSTKVVFGNGVEEFQVSLFAGKMEMCDRHLNTTGCVSTDLKRLGSFKIVSLLECVLVVGLSAVIAIFLLLFACGATSLPSRFPFIFIVAPRITCSFSGLFFLQFANMQRFMSLYGKGEMKFWLWMIMEMFFPMPPAKDPAKDARLTDNNSSAEDPTTRKAFSACGCGRRRGPYEPPEDQTQAAFDYGFEDDSAENANGTNKTRKCRECRDTVMFWLSTMAYICLLALSLNALLIKLTTIIFSPSRERSIGRAQRFSFSLAL